MTPSRVADYCDGETDPDDIEIIYYIRGEIDLDDKVKEETNAEETKDPQINELMTKFETVTVKEAKEDGTEEDYEIVGEEETKV